MVVPEYRSPGQMTHHLSPLGSYVRSSPILPTSLELTTGSRHASIESTSLTMPDASTSDAPSSPPSRVLSPSSSAGNSDTSLRALELEQGLTNGAALERTNTLSTLGGFEFEHALLPLSLSGDADAEGGRGPQAEHKHVGLLQGTSCGGEGRLTRQGWRSSSACKSGRASSPLPVSLSTR